MLLDNGSGMGTFSQILAGELSLEQVERFLPTHQSGQPDVAVCLASLLITQCCEGLLEIGAIIAVAPSYRDQLFADEMEADDLGTGLLFEVTDDRIANHFVQLFQRAGNGKKIDWPRASAA